MSFAELLEEVKSLSPSEKAALRSFLSEDLLDQEESEELLAQLDAATLRLTANNLCKRIRRVTNEATRMTWSS